MRKLRSVTVLAMAFFMVLVATSAFAGIYEVPTLHSEDGTSYMTLEGSTSEQSSFHSWETPATYLNFDMAHINTNQPLIMGWSLTNLQMDPSTVSTLFTLGTLTFSGHYFAEGSLSRETLQGIQGDNLQTWNLDDNVDHNWSSTGTWWDEWWAANKQEGNWKVQMVWWNPAMDGGASGRGGVGHKEMYFSVTPEPATLSLFGLGLAGLLRFRKKKV